MQQTKLLDSSSDDEISFKITAEERERVLSPQEWPPSPVDHTPEEEEVVEKPVNSVVFAKNVHLK